MKRIRKFFAPGLETELQEMRTALARHQRIFRGSHGYGYFDWDLNAKRMDWSGGYWRYLGYTDDDVDYISVMSNYYDYVHPDDVSRVQAAVKVIIGKPGPAEVTYRVRRKKGGYIWTELRADSVRDEKGWVHYVSGIAFDVTKQKQTEQALLISEARHARIIQSSNDGIWEWAAEHGGFHFSNRCWEHLGYSESDRESNQGIDRVQSWRRRMHPEDGEEFDRAMAAHVRGEAPFDVEYRIRGKDGEWRWIRARGQMAFSEGGEPIRMSGTNMDITQLKLAEERVLKAKEAAEKANRAKSEFLSSMSHELRTPLNAILGFAQLIEMGGDLSVDQRDNVGEIRRAGAHLLQLIGDVLDLAKIESGRINLTSEIITPVSLIQECLALVKTQAEDRGIQLRLQTNGLASHTVCADRMRLKQILLNLIGNAIKYNRAQGSVTVECAREADAYFRIIVRDTGRGIPVERQSEMFQPFNRLGAELGSIEGSGVGLVITRQLVTHLGGRIDFHSREGEGSEFWVDIPIASASVQATSHKQEAPLADPSRLTDLQVQATKRILYVEDNISNQRLVSQLLRQYPQLEVELAIDALRGLFLARTRKPDLILMDINLPGMNGFEALEVLKSDPSTQQIPVVALSANALRHDVEKGNQAGFVCYLTKPIDLEQLLRTINGILGDTDTDTDTDTDSGTDADLSVSPDFAGASSSVK